MGVKYTVLLTRKEAEDKVRGMIMQMYGKVSEMSNWDLADLCEDLNDSAHEGEGYQNYRIEG